ncbi:MATE family efflux transporter, partial [Rhizobium sp. SIMBA_035]
FAGHLFVQMQTDIASVRETAFQYLPYLAVLPLIAVWSYLLDGLFIGATRALEMRNAMLISVLIAFPVAWALHGYGNHGLWIS